MTEEERAAATRRLAEAREALHQLIVGTAVVSIETSDGRKTEFGRAKMQALRAYISELERELGVGRRRGALSPRFG